LDKLADQGFITIATDEKAAKSAKASVYNQTAEKIYNIEKIDKADFS